MLLELMEFEAINDLLNTDNYEIFNRDLYEFKAKIINLSSVTNKYIENLLNDIEVRMMELVDFKAIK